MKKSIIRILLIIGIIVLLCACNSFEKIKKDIQSDVGGGIERKIVVTNLFTGEEVWSFTGISYIDDHNTVGSITIIYYEDSISKKADFIGEFYGLFAEEI